MLDEQKFSLSQLKGISKVRKELLAKLGITNLDELIRFFPRDYEDWTTPKNISSLAENEVETFVARVYRKPNLRRKGPMSILKTVLNDNENSQITATWFNQPYYESKLIVDKSYLFRGKIKRNGLILEIVNPTFEAYNEDETAGIKPVYHLTAGLTQGVIRRLVTDALAICNTEFEDPLPFDIRKKLKLCSVNYAYEKIHHPNNSEEFEIARYRLVFEELFLIQAGLKLVKSTLVNKTKAIPIPSKSGILKPFYDHLPFSLTESQIEVIGEVLSDMKKEMPMNRLVQGDVGSGKTVVSAAAIYCCIRNGCQATLMAPTAVLANQHFNTMKTFFDGFDVKIELLTGSVTAKRKKEINEATKAGDIQLLIGTHAILEEGVTFKNLGLAVTDEQHRFGVKQRSNLSQKGDRLPHVLVMSATPIPRTLGFVLYGDLDISIIKGMPKGRVPIETYTATSGDDHRIYELIDKQIEQGRQVYVVCPMIESTEAADLNSVKELYAQMKTDIFPHRKIGLMYGSLPLKEKEIVMNAFMCNEIQVLVSTTVIEVGVDNPNASIMLILNAERFGLAQLHQLRGRIGRGCYRSICILKSDSDQDIAKERLRTVCKNSDGFKIAEQDLKLRGIGDFFGTRQHGLPEMKIANLYRDAAILKDAQTEIELLFEKDPFLELPGNEMILPMIKRQFGNLYEHIGL